MVNTTFLDLNERAFLRNPQFDISLISELENLKISEPSKENTSIIKNTIEKSISDENILNWLLNFISPFSEDKTKTFVYKLQDLLRYYYNSSSLRSLIKGKYKVQGLESEILTKIVMDFGEVGEVQSIYVQKHLEEIQVSVLLSIEHYDDTLIDKLLDLEYDIRKAYSDVLFEFFYPPIGPSNKQDFIYPAASCIYSR